MKHIIIIIISLLLMGATTAKQSDSSEHSINDDSYLIEVFSVAAQKSPGWNEGEFDMHFGNWTLGGPAPHEAINNNGFSGRIGKDKYYLRIKEGVIWKIELTSPPPKRRDRNTIWPDNLRKQNTISDNLRAKYPGATIKSTKTSLLSSYFVRSQTGYELNFFLNKSRIRIDFIHKDHIGSGGAWRRI